MQHDDSLLRLKAELKEQGKRDTNDFFREEADPAGAFQRLMDNAKPLLDYEIERLPAVDASDFGERVLALLETLVHHDEFAQNAAIEKIARASGSPKGLLKKALRQRSISLQSSVAGKQEQPVHRTRTLIDQVVRLYMTEKGMSTVPQVPLGEVVDLVVEDVKQKGATFVYDRAANVPFMQLDELMIEVDRRNKDFGDFFFEMLPISSVNRDPLKDIADGFKATICRPCHARQVDGLECATFLYDERMMAIHTGNPTQEIVLIRPSADGKTPLVEVVKNGEHGIFLRPPQLHDRKAKFTYTGADCTHHGMEKLRSFAFDAQALPASDKLRSAAHKLLMLVPFGLRRKMRKANRGIQGSGKTTDADLLVILASGGVQASAFNEEKALWAALSSNMLVALDNLEGLEKRQVENTLLLHATGGSKEFRKLYTDNTPIRYRPNAHIIETGIEGFSTPESIEREQLYNFDARYHDPKFSITSLERDVVANRSLMLSALYNAMSLHVLPTYMERIPELEELLRQLRHPKKRFNDFIAHQLLIVEAVRPYWGTQTAAGEARSWAHMWNAEARLMNTNSDPGVLRLEAIFSGAYNDTAIVLGRQKLIDGITSNELYGLFCQLEKSMGLPRAYQNQLVLAQRLPSMVKAWQHAGGRFVTTTKRNRKIYFFRPAADDELGQASQHVTFLQAPNAPVGGVTNRDQH